jgi:hypothetical protein
LRDNLANSPKYWQRAFDFFAAGGRRPVLFGAPTCVFLAHRPSVDANVQYPGRVTAASTWQARNAAFVTDSLFFGQQISEPARVHGDRAADPVRRISWRTRAEAGRSLLLPILRLGDSLTVGFEQLILQRGAAPAPGVW